MRIRKNKNKYRPPTVEEFLQFRPKRNDIEWSKNAEGLVELKVPKFKSNFGKSFCKVTRKDQIFAAKMDSIGTIVWENCDGKKTVKTILNKVKKAHPKAEDIDQRLFSFLQQMHSLNYLDLF